MFERVSTRMLALPVLFALVWALAVPAAGGAQPSSSETLRDLAERASARVLVKAADPDAVTAVDAAAARLGASSVTASGLPGVRVAEVPAGAAEVVAQRLSANPNVAYAEPDVVLTTSQVVPDDPAFPQQWGLHKINVPTAWAVTTGSEDVVIAVVDTGVDASHPELAGKVLPGRNFVNDTNDTDDDHGHGTATASVAAMNTDNATYGAGVCWSCKILPVKSMGTDGGGLMSNVAKGVRWAADQGADVITLSLGSQDPNANSTTLRSAMQYAVDAGAFVVAAAGNEGTEVKSWPAAFDEVVGVAMTDEDDDLFTDSNRGSWVEVAAPGRNLSAWPENKFMWYFGTSSATPVVGGVAALLKAAVPDAPVAAVRHAIEQTTVGIGPGVEHGRIDAAAAIALLPGILDQDPVDPEPTDPDPKDPDPKDPDPKDPDPRGDPVERIAGANRSATAAAISKARFSPGVERVYIGTGGSFADALAAGPAAARFDSPVLLTAANNLPPETLAELERLQPGRIVVAGGTAAVSDAVVDRLRRVAETVRMAGANRYDTAGKVAVEAFDGPVPVVYVASGRGFADALAGSAAAGAKGAPLLLTEPGSVPAETAAALQALQPGRIVLLGGQAAVSSAVQTQLAAFTSGQVQRLQGADRFATGVAVAKDTYPNGADTAWIATGTDFPDALAGGPAAAAVDAPLLLVRHGELPAVVAAELDRLGADQVFALGGPGAISDAVLDAVKNVVGS